MKKILLLMLILATVLLFAISCTPGKDNGTDNGNNDGTTPGLDDTNVSVDLSGITFESITVDYNGKAKAIQVKGILPSGVTVKYEGNNCRDAGVHTVVAKFYYNGTYIEGADLTATITIKKASYDLSGITFPKRTFTYTGETYTPSISGELPEGVTVEYICDSEIKNAGTYIVTAHFTCDPNYNAIPNMSTTYVVNKAEYDMSAITFASAMVEYSGEPYYLAIEGDLPAGVSVSYENNGQIDVGEYRVRAVFTSSDSNYADPDSMFATITITPEKMYPVELLYTLKSDGSYEISGYVGDNPHLIISSTYEGRMVTSIKSSAFEGNTNIVYVQMPSSIVNIGNKAFKDCTSIVSFTLSNKLEVIGYQAFANLPITTLVLPDTLTSIGQGALKGMPLESLTLPFIGGSRQSSNAYLGYLFGASSYTGNAAVVPSTLAKVTLSNTAESIPAFAFFGISGITEVVVGNKLSFIGNSAFYGTSITSIYLPKSVVEIPADASAQNSPFYGLSDNFLIVLENTVTEGFGQHWNSVSADRKAITAHMKSYNYYLENKDALLSQPLDSADLSAIVLGNTLISGFDSAVLNYSETADINKGYPKVAASAASALANVTVEQATSSNGGVATITVLSGDLSVTKVYTVTFTVTGDFTTSAEIVNKNGTNGAVAFVIDDGDENTAKITKNFLNKYHNLELTYAIITNRLATLRTVTNSDGTITYVMDGDKYTYTTNADKVTFWRNILDSYSGRTEIISHTYSHAFWGTNDDGGSFQYVDSNGNLLTSNNLPVGSVTAEILGSKQIIEDLFGIRAITTVEPGISVKDTDQFVNGQKIPTYHTYYKEILNNFINDGLIAGVRGGTRGVMSDYTPIITTKDTINKTEVGVPSLMIRLGETPDQWCRYIDQAESAGGLAVFCIHKIISDGTTGSGHYVYESAAEVLFEHATSKNLWVANYTEAYLYFAEWSTASVSSVYWDGQIKVTLIDGEDNALFNEALTVKVRVPATWSSAMMDGELLTVHTDSNGSYVYANIVPDSGTKTITCA